MMLHTKFAKPICVQSLIPVCWQICPVHMLILRSKKKQEQEDEQEARTTTVITDRSNVIRSVYHKVKEQCYIINFHQCSILQKLQMCHVYAL